MDAVVEVATGKLRGRREATVDVFQAVPYAAPPCGSLRFRPPQPCEPWVRTREARGRGPWAPQRPVAVPLLRFDSGFAQDESCLTVSIWAPRRSRADCPVIVFLHGGGFVRFSGESNLTDGAALAHAADAVVVAVNYRLGVLGFLAHEDLRDEHAGCWGNWGLLDQIAALRWIQENVAAFGGDPSNVTIVGESAGGISVNALMVAPAARGLFHRAVIQSGPPYAIPAPMADATAIGIADHLGVHDVAALRLLPVAALLEAQDQLLARNAPTRLPLGPVIDGPVLAGHPGDVAEGGAGPSVPALIGTNADEVRLFFAHDPAALLALDEEGLVALLERSFALDDLPQSTTAVVDAYRTGRGARGESLEPSALWTAIETDRIFLAPTRRLVEARARRGEVTYRYLFTWRSPAHDGALGACHALELPFVFGTLAHPAITPFSGDSIAARRLASTMQRAWAAFVHDGVPTVDGAEVWPDRPDRVMELGESCGVLGPEGRAELAVWEVAQG